MEVGLAAGVARRGADAAAHRAADGRPGWKLACVLAATSLSRPEATLIVVGIVGVAVVQRARARNWRAIGWWLVPLAAPALWLPRIARSPALVSEHRRREEHFYLPGFDWTYWRETVAQQTGLMMKTLFASKDSPLVLRRSSGAGARGLRARDPVGASRAPPAGRRAGDRCADRTRARSRVHVGRRRLELPELSLHRDGVSVGRDARRARLTPPPQLRGHARHAWLGAAGVIALVFVVQAWAPMRDHMLLFAQAPPTPTRRS